MNQSERMQKTEIVTQLVLTELLRAQRDAPARAFGATDHALVVETVGVAAAAMGVLVRMPLEALQTALGEQQVRAARETTRAADETETVEASSDGSIGGGFRR